MLHPISIQHPEDDVFFTSDLHVGHDRDFIYGPRGFKSVHEHDETLIARWNETCSETSIVFHLGDLVFKDPEGKRFEELVRRLRFAVLNVMIGNHTSGHRQVYQRTLSNYIVDPGEVYPLHWDLAPDRLVTFLPQYAEVKVNGQPIVLCHYPIESWNGMAKGTPMLFGHCHSSLRRTMPRRRDVGIEAYGRPVSLKRLLKDMEDEKPAVVDHHGEA